MKSASTGASKLATKAIYQPIYLASKSPRRRELLRQIGIDFELLLFRELAPRGPDVDELVLPGEAAEAYVVRVTREKATRAMQLIEERRLPQRPILTADTTVVAQGQILGKPHDAADAARMLRLLSGASHQVLTSVVLCIAGNITQITQRSLVSFTTLSENTIAHYCATTEPYDKAGGYAIQGYAARFICDMSGSYSGIMGLPLFETTQLLQQAGIDLYE